MKAQRGSDGGFSEILGTMLIIGVTVTFVAVATVQIYAGANETHGTIRLNVNAHANDTALTLLHVGGVQIDLGEVRVLLEAAGDLEIDQAAGALGEKWSVGEILILPYPHPLPPGRAELALVHRERGETLATATVVLPMPPPTSAPVGFAVTTKVDGSSSPPPVTPPKHLLIEATVTHNEGRRYVRQVFANLSEVNGPVWVALHDDGTRGDATAGDGKWSALLSIPLGAPPGSRTLRFNAIDLDGATVIDAVTITVI